MRYEILTLTRYDGVMIHLTFDECGTGRRDIVVRCGGVQLRGDSYYFRLDRSISPHTETAEKGLEVIRKMVESWRDRLSHFGLLPRSATDSTVTTDLEPPAKRWAFWRPRPPAAAVFLPVLLDDQSSHWLRCQPVADGFRLELGSSELEGHRVQPTKPERWPAEIADFRPLPGSDVTLTREELVNTFEQAQRISAGPLTPEVDPTPIFEIFRGSYGTELLTAAVAHFNLFGLLERQGPLTAVELGQQLQLAERPMHVLVTALKAMRLLDGDHAQRLWPSKLARHHLVPGQTFDITGYVGLAALSPGVAEMVERLKTNRPAGLKENEDGTAFIFRAGRESAMEKSDLARHFTLSLAGRAKNVAPALAAAVDLSSAKVLLDLAGGSGIYSVALLRRFPELRAVLFDRPEVLRVSEEFCPIDENAAVPLRVASRLQRVAGDMFVDSFPSADVILLSNVLHDWDVSTCRELIHKCAAALPSGGRLLIHDVFLNDTLDGPLPIALYSAALFTLTEGRAYSRAEYASWLQAEGLTPSGPIPTLIHCGVLTGVKP